MKKKKDSRRLYHKKYYRIRTLAKLRNRIKALEKSLQEIVESPEGIAYRNRKSKEYQKEYRTKNNDKIVAYRKEYKNIYG
jgi:hypothetical protein|tara:strand:+ start:442 stop:681 length:240 start_codon:yes stop_codon:yes gene_type:complete